MVFYNVLCLFRYNIAVPNNTRASFLAYLPRSCASPLSRSAGLSKTRFVLDVRGLLPLATV